MLALIATHLIVVPTLLTPHTVDLTRFLKFQLTVSYLSPSYH